MKGGYIAGLPRYGTNVRLKLTFVAREPVEGHRGRMKLATLGDEPQFLAVNKAGKVAMWEHELDKMLPVADSVEALILPTKTTKTPRELYAAEVDKATALVKQDKYKPALRVLEKLAAPTKSTDKLQRFDDEASEQHVHNVWGLCLEHTGKLDDALAHFERAGNGGVLNYARLAIAAADKPRMRKVLAKLDKLRSADDDVIFHALNYAGQLGVLLGDRKVANAKYKLLRRGRRPRAR